MNQIKQGKWVASRHFFILTRHRCKKVGNHNVRAQVDNTGGAADSRKLTGTDRNRQ